MSKTLVLKFGGTSVGGAERIAHLPDIVAPLLKSYSTVVVVSSAMSKFLASDGELRYGAVW